MTDPAGPASSGRGRDPGTARRPLRGAMRRGARRATVHLLKAGVEVVAGVGAFLDEIARSRRRESTDRTDRGPTRIDVE